MSDSNKRKMRLSHAGFIVGGVIAAFIITVLFVSLLGGLADGEVYDPETGQQIETPGDP